MDVIHVAVRTVGVKGQYFCLLFFGDLDKRICTALGRACDSPNCIRSVHIDKLHPLMPTSPSDLGCADKLLLKQVVGNLKLTRWADSTCNSQELHIMGFIHPLPYQHLAQHHLQHHRVSSRSTGCQRPCHSRMADRRALLGVSGWRGRRPPVIGLLLCPESSHCWIALRS